jgi:hypothetical protein
MLRVLANPNRPIGWKIFDALSLSAGVVLVVICLVSAGPDRLFLYFFLWPIVYIVTQRSWWDNPGILGASRRRTRSGDKLCPVSSFSDTWGLR